MSRLASKSRLINRPNEIWKLQFIDSKTVEKYSSRVEETGLEAAVELCERRDPLGTHGLCGGVEEAYAGALRKGAKGGAIAFTVTGRVVAQSQHLRCGRAGGVRWRRRRRGAGRRRRARASTPGARASRTRTPARCSPTAATSDRRWRALRTRRRRSAQAYPRPTTNRNIYIKSNQQVTCSSDTKWSLQEEPIWAHVYCHPEECWALRRAMRNGHIMASIARVEGNDATRIVWGQESFGQHESAAVLVDEPPLARVGLARARASLVVYCGVCLLRTWGRVAWRWVDSGVKRLQQRLFPSGRIGVVWAVRRESEHVDAVVEYSKQQALPESKSEIEELHVENRTGKSIAEHILTL